MSQKKTINISNSEKIWLIKNFNKMQQHVTKYPHTAGFTQKKIINSLVEKLNNLETDALTLERREVKFIKNMLEGQGERRGFIAALEYTTIPEYKKRIKTKKERIKYQPYIERATNKLKMLKELSNKLEI